VGRIDSAIASLFGVHLAPNSHCDKILSLQRSSPAQESVVGISCKPIVSRDRPRVDTGKNESRLLLPMFATCTACNTPTDLRGSECWNCGSSTKDHPTRSELSYLIGYSWVSNVTLCACGVLSALLLLSSFVALLAGRVALPDFLITFVACALGLIVSCRLLAR